MSILRFFRLDGALEKEKNEPTQKNRIVVLYQSKNSNLPLGITAVKGKIVGYRCGKGEPCHLDGKEHKNLPRKTGRKKCSTCEYVQILIEMHSDSTYFE